MNFDYSSIASVHLSANAVDLTGTGANTLKLSLGDVLNAPMTNGVHQLTLTGDASDSVELAPHEWFNSGDCVTEGARTYMVFNPYNHSAAQLLIDQSMVNVSHVL